MGQRPLIGKATPNLLAGMEFFSFPSTSKYQEYEDLLEVETEVIWKLQSVAVSHSEKAPVGINGLVDFAEVGSKQFIMQSDGAENGEFEEDGPPPQTEHEEEDTIVAVDDDDEGEDEDDDDDDGDGDNDSNADIEYYEPDLYDIEEEQDVIYESSIDIDGDSDVDVDSNNEDSY
ncbi:unnamed protein product [Orchesella dallaii]|uniref:Replicase polyprotein 1a n=1 Tax=Orchesella dallaii TaxID=48710 RepID=A0ABP1Q7N3_9HEXA